MPHPSRCPHFLLTSAQEGMVCEDTSKCPTRFSPCPSLQLDPALQVCGPPGMMAAISGPKAKDFTQGEVDGALKDLGYESSMVYKF